MVALWHHKSITRGRAKDAHHVIFYEGLIIDVLEAHVLRLTDDDFVVGLKPHAFRRKFDALIAELGLESLGLTPASMRAGGATERHLQRKPTADISWLLRHADVSTTRHYIQSAATMLALARIPAVAAAVVEDYAGNARRALRQLCRSPPPSVVVVKRSRARSAPAVRRQSTQYDLSLRVFLVYECIFQFSFSINLNVVSNRNVFRSIASLMIDFDSCRVILFVKARLIFHYKIRQSRIGTVRGVFAAVFV